MSDMVYNESDIQSSLLYNTYLEFLMHLTLPLISYRKCLNFIHCYAPYRRKQFSNRNSMIQYTFLIRKKCTFGTSDEPVFKFRHNEISRAHKSRKEKIIMMKSKVTKMRIAVILMAAMLMSLAGCSKGSSSGNTGNVSSTRSDTTSNSNYTSPNTSSTKPNQGGNSYGNSGNVNVNYDEKKECSQCSGLGVCSECFGEGEFHCDSYCIGGRCIYCSDDGKILVRFDSNGNPKYKNCPYCSNGRCKKCNGTGWIDCRYCTDGKCPSCHGKGYV